MTSNAPFTPGVGAGYNQSVSATTTAASVTLTAGSGSLRIANAGAGAIAYATGKGSATAVMGANCAVLSGESRIFSIPIDHDTVSVVSASTSTVYLSRGEGV
jgi:hypothetical protein